MHDQIWVLPNNEHFVSFSKSFVAQKQVRIYAIRLISCIWGKLVLLYILETNWNNSLQITFLYGYVY